MLGPKKKTTGKAGKDSRGRLQPRIDAIDAHAVDGGGSLRASMGAWAATSSSLGGQVAMRCDGRIEQSASYSWQLLSQRVWWLAPRLERWCDAAGRSFALPSWGRTNGWRGQAASPIQPHTASPCPCPGRCSSQRAGFITSPDEMSFPNKRALTLFFQHDVGSGQQSEWPQFFRRLQFQSIVVLD